MEYDFSTSAASKEHRNPPPRRGQIKAKIIGGLFRSVVAIGTRIVGRGSKLGSEGGRSSASGSPGTLCGYALEESSDGRRVNLEQLSSASRVVRLVLL